MEGDENDSNIPLWLGNDRGPAAEGFVDLRSLVLFLSRGRGSDGRTGQPGAADGQSTRSERK